MQLRKKLNIQAQFFLTYIAIALVIILIFSVFFYVYISDILIQRETSNFEQLAESFLDQTDTALHTMDDVSLNIGYSNLVLSKLDSYLEYAPTASEFSTLVELFVALNGVDYKVSQINVFGNSGRGVMVGPYTNTFTVNMEELPWTEAADAAKGFKVISLPYQSSKMLNNSTVSLSYLSLYRQLYDGYGRQIGYIETVQTCKKVFKGIISYLNSNRDSNSVHIYVYNENGSLMYPYEEDMVLSQDASLYTHYYNCALDSASSSLFTNPLTDENELVTSVTSAYSGWTYVCSQEEAVILAPVKAFTRVLVLVVIFVISLVLLISYIMSKSLTRPIHQLLKAFRKTKIDTLGELKKDTLHTSFNEFDELNDAFYQMSNDLKTSMDTLIETRQQELKSRSLAMQSQINPHFYYNSLSSIMVLAENGQTEDVIKFSRNLTSMMRYITHGNMQIVTMQAEIAYIQKYMYCMKVRYQSSLNYTVQVDEALNDIEIPKLLIQPLVENALKYGTDCEPPWEVNVESEITDSYWLIHVSDSGPGFTQEALDVIQERFQNADNTIGMPETKIDGMGMLNVYQRWKLYSKDTAIFRYGNRPQGGSIVSIGKYIAMPLQEE